MITRQQEQNASDSNTKPEKTLRHFSLSGIALRLFITCWMVYALHFATNTVREIYPALTLGDHLSFDVSEYSDLHPDIFEIPGRGAFINNNPGASIMGAVPYVVSRPVVDFIVDRVQKARAVSSGPVPEYDSIYPMAREFYRKSRERGLDVKFGLAAGVMQAFCMAPISALSVVVMFYILISLKLSYREAIFLSLLYAFATPVLYRTAQLNHNILVSHFAFFSFVLMWRPWDDPSSPRKPRYLLAGLLCGWTIVLDYSAIAAVCGLSVYMFIKWISLPEQLKSRYGFFYFAMGVLLSIAVLMLYQWHSFGNPFLPAQYYMPSATFTGYGYRGMDWPRLDLLWETAFGMRYGLFTSAPILLLALYLSAWFRDSIRIVKGPEILCIAIICIAYFIFCSANQYGRMQFNSGVRHIVPVIPFLFLIVSGVLLRLPTFFAGFISILATYWSWCLAMYRDVEGGWGIFESILNITTGGIRFPWLVTLERMGYVPAGAFALPFLLLLGLLLLLIWGVRISNLRPDKFRAKTKNCNF